MASRAGLLIAAAIFMAPVALEIVYSGHASSQEPVATSIRRQQLADRNEARRLRELAQAISDESADELLDCLRRGIGADRQIARATVKACMARPLAEFEDALHTDPAQHE